METLLWEMQRLLFRNSLRASELLAELITVANRGEIEEGKGKCVDVMGQEVAIFFKNGQYYALQNTCAHRGGPLCEGEITNHEVICPLHAWSYDLKSGECTNMPGVKVAVYKVVVDGGEVKIEVP